MYITRDSEYLVTGGGIITRIEILKRVEKGVINIRKLHSLHLVHKLAVESAICSLTMSPDERHLLVVSP